MVNLGFSNILFLSDNPSKIVQTLLFSLIRPICHVQPIHLQLLVLIILGEENEALHYAIPSISYHFISL
jgi:hypothetical protein